MIFMFSIASLATSVTKMISRKYKLHVLYRKMLISLSHQKIQIIAMSYSFFLWVVVFNFTIVWVRENSIFLFRTQKSCSLSCLQPAAL